MLVDAEMGMPLDLNQFDGVWDGDDSAINPTSGPNEIDPEDAILLTPATTDEVKPAPTEVSWMRSGNLFMRKMVGKKGEAKAAARYVYVLSFSCIGDGAVHECSGS
jgi:RNA polymerase II-associated factor 1